MVLDGLDRVWDFFLTAGRGRIDILNGKLENFPKNLLP